MSNLTESWKMAQPIHGTIGKVQFNNYHTEIREIINNYFQNVDNF